MNILFYPANVKHHSKIRYLIDHLGFKTTNDPSDQWDIGIFWNYDTVRAYPRELMDEGPMINRDCLDNTKTHVDQVFKQVFGYSSFLDPTLHRGYAIEKSEDQAVHDGRIVSCPRDPQKGKIYQKLIDTRVSELRVQDIRVPVFEGQVPLVWLKTKHPINTFEHKDRNRESVKVVKPDQVFTPDELAKIRQFCQLFPVDYGELDILRSNYDGRIYIIDVNNTPGDSLMFQLDQQDNDITVKVLSRSLVEMLQNQLS